MANITFDITKMAQRLTDDVLDGTRYGGLSIREWIANIASGKYTKDRSYMWYTWDFQGEKFRCRNCDKTYDAKQMGDEIWRFCPKCGFRMKVRDGE